MGITTTGMIQVLVWPGVIFGFGVWLDARKHRVAKLPLIGWVAGTLALWVVFLPLYLRARPQYVIVGRDIHASEAAALALYHANRADEAAAEAAAKNAADAHMVCPHCQIKGTVTTAMFTILANDGYRSVYKRDGSGNSLGRTDDHWFDNKRAGELNQARCSTCLAVWEI